MLLTDGAQEMVDALDEQFTRENLGVEPRRLLDFWHAVEKLAPAARVIHGDDAAKLVLARWRTLLLNTAGAPERIKREILASGKDEAVVSDDEGKKVRPVHAAITYLVNQGARMDFAAARGLGLPIGSGNVEATCKSLVRQRLVRAGSRWKTWTAQHIVDLRALALSSRWDSAIRLTFKRQLHRVRRVA